MSSGALNPQLRRAPPAPCRSFPALLDFALFQDTPAASLAVTLAAVDAPSPGAFQLAPAALGPWPRRRTGVAASCLGAAPRVTPASSGTPRPPPLRMPPGRTQVTVLRGRRAGQGAQGAQGARRAPRAPRAPCAFGGAPGGPRRFRPEAQVSPARLGRSREALFVREGAISPAQWRRLGWAPWHAGWG